MLINLLIALPLCVQSQSFEIKIIQDSVFYKPDSNNVVWLKKGLFKLQVELKNLEGVYLYAAFKDSIYKLENSQQVPDFKNLPAMSMAEETFNPLQELSVSDDGWSYWFYDAKEDWHRMDKDVTISKESVIITKSIKQFFITPGEKTLPIIELNDTLYLFFISAKGNKKMELVKELQRYKLKIQWL